MRKIWAIWGVFLFLLMMLVLGVPVLLVNMVLTPGPRALRRNIAFLHHVFTPLFLTLVGIRLKVEGKQHLDPRQSYVIVSNHRTSLDFIVNAAAFPGIFRFLAKQELQKIPVFGWVVKKMCLTVDRSSAMSRARSVVDLKNQLAAGWSIFIYPEGGRNRTEDPLGPFFDGAFRIAIQTKAPIAVQTVCNIHQVTASARAVDLWPGTLRIVWSEPIPTGQLGSDDINNLKEEVRRRMLAHLQA
ncbi:MAG TPA: lysophospholipid acyltransferase family protein [Saprospiraceae bacterium]|nr:lysophospholipid acyltransferase family protein [Saprospiraceae bacterium]